MSTTANLARLKKGADTFEVVVDPDKAMHARKSQGSVQDALLFPEVYSDAKKGMKAPDDKLKSAFGTTDPVACAKEIINRGDIQVTAEYRQKQVEQKRKRIIDIIQKQGVDPRTNTPHPSDRVERALVEAKVRIDEFKPVEEQVQTILKAIRPIIPIKLVTKHIKIRIPPEHAAKAMHVAKNFGKLVQESWQNDGSWTATLEVPGGMESEFYDKLNGITHGTLQAEVVRTTGETT